MIKKLSQLFGVTAFLMVSGHSVQAATFQDAELGGVNLSAWCAKQHGTGFKAKLIGKTAGDWTCERSAGDRRPVSVKNACKLQYGNKAYKAKALNWNDPLSWKCFEKQEIPTMKGVNLTAWCQKKFGKAFKAKLIQKHAGGWACEQSIYNRRPVVVNEACKLQYGKNSLKAMTLNWNDPYSWKCLLR